MKKIIYFCFSIALLFTLTGAVHARYTSYPEGTASTRYLSKTQLNYVIEMIRLLHGKDFNFVIRKDPGHWIGVGTDRGANVLYIHDESAQFNCRARVNTSTGQLIIVKGIGLNGQTQKQDADLTAERAASYLTRVMEGTGVFTQKKEPAAAAVQSKKKAASHTEKKAAPHPEKKTEEPKTAEKELSPVMKLKEGNRRFAAGASIHPNRNGGRVAELAKGQHPFAIVVCCSDSRVPPEVIFDQGMGDIFVVRTAGEVVQNIELGSIEYAAEHLHSPLIVVLGHKRCGAVDATIKGGELPDNIKAIAALITPAVEKAKTMKGDLLDNAVRENVSNVAKKIEESPVIHELLKEHKIIIVKSYYDLDTGKVEFQQ